MLVPFCRIARRYRYSQYPQNEETNTAQPSCLYALVLDADGWIIPESQFEFGAITHLFVYLILNHSVND